MSFRMLSASCTIVMVSVLTVIPAVAQESESLPVEIMSEGSQLQAQFYPADCNEDCRTFLLIPGYPGSQKPDVLGFGERLSADGLHVLVVNPRGIQRSEGTMSFSNTLADIGAAFEWLHGDEAMNRFGVDTSAIVVGGHSFGGGTSMAYAARDPRVEAVVSFAGTDHGVFIRLFQRDSTFASQIGGYLQSTMAADGPVRGDYETTIRELEENQDIFGLRENASKLADRSILLFGGWEDKNVTIDEYMLPLYRALRKAGAEDVTLHVYHDDHGFGEVRDRLETDLLEWVRQHFD